MMMQGCAVNKKLSTNQEIQKTDTTVLTTIDSTAFNNKNESSDKSIEETNVDIQEQITESIVDSINRTTTNRTINRTIRQTYNKKNNISFSDTTFITHTTIDTLKNVSTEKTNVQTTTTKKETQIFKWIFLIALAVFISFIIKKFC